MKRTMNEYNNSMNKIVPSESFISETEALMRKLRDEQNECSNDTKENPLPEEVKRIDISANAKTIRMKKWTIGLSAAAAVMVCAVSLNVYNRTQVETSMTQDVETEVSETTASAETTAPVSEGEDEASATTTASAAEIIEETSAVTTASEIIKEEDKENDTKNEQRNNGSDKQSSDSNDDEQDPDFGAEPSESHGVDAVNTVDDNIKPVEYTEPVSPTEGEPMPSETVYTGWNWNDPSDYIEEEEPESDVDTEYGAPVWVPSFIDESLEEEVSDEDFYDEAEEEADDYSVSETSYNTAPAYTLDVSFKSSLSGADDVYVPDSISDLDEGEYYISAEAGFDEVNDSTGQLIASGGTTFSETDVEKNSGIIAVILSVTEGKGQYHYDEETKMYDYRFKLTIYSADKSENNAKLFEIIFNKGELVINRYDNRTVSSEKYILTDEEYNRLDSYLRSLG